MKAVRLVVAEDNAFALEVILGKLSADDEFTVCATVTTGRQLLQRLPQLGRVDLVLMDIEMPDMNGIEATRELKAQFPGIKVLILTIFDDDENIYNAILAGADGYVLKEESGDKIRTAILEMLDGGAGMSAGVAARVLRMMKMPRLEPALLEDFNLTMREVEILEKLKAGFTYEKIASQLFISSGTVRKHIEHVYRKLQVHNKVEAVQKASKANII
ncbi:MAG: response regulator transcription factor [Cyclobacteriaceae bacterium]|nr:response regulator transcription factor [Cyclobacteriaceae bacterium]